MGHNRGIPNLNLVRTVNYILTKYCKTVNYIIIKYLIINKKTKTNYEDTLNKVVYDHLRVMLP